MNDAHLRVLVGSESPSGRASLRALLDGERIVGELTSPRDLDVTADADALVLDGNFARLLDALPVWSPVLVVLATDDETWTVVRELRPSGWALLPSDADAREVTAALSAAMMGLAVLPVVLAEQHFTEPPAFQSTSFDLPEALTPRERDVLALLANGDPNKRIASKLDISENTVKFHLSALYSKFGVSSRAAALREGVRRGLVSI